MSDLLSLPPELRNRTYEYVLAPVDKQAISIIHERRNRLHKSTTQILSRAGKLPRAPDMALLLTCRKIHGEEAALLYSKFHFGLWPVSVNTGSRHQLRHMGSETLLFREMMQGRLCQVRHLDIGFLDLVQYISDDSVQERPDSRLVTSTLPGLTKCSGEPKRLSYVDEAVMVDTFRVVYSSMSNVRCITWHDSGKEGVGEIDAWIPFLKDWFPKFDEFRVLKVTDAAFETETYRVEGKKLIKVRDILEA